MNLLCEICMESVMQSEDVRATSCGHLFHYDCLFKWFSNGHNTCPHCRQQNVSHNLLKIFLNAECENLVLINKNRNADQLKEDLNIAQESLHTLKNDLDRRTEDNQELQLKLLSIEEFHKIETDKIKYTNEKLQLKFFSAKDFYESEMNKLKEINKKLRLRISAIHKFYNEKIDKISNKADECTLSLKQYNLDLPKNNKKDESLQECIKKLNGAEFFLHNSTGNILKTQALTGISAAPAKFLFEKTEDIKSNINKIPASKITNHQKPKQFNLITKEEFDLGNNVANSKNISNQLAEINEAPSINLFATNTTVPNSLFRNFVEFDKKLDKSYNKFYQNRTTSDIRGFSLGNCKDIAICSQLDETERLSIKVNPDNAENSNENLRNSQISFSSGNSFETNNEFSLNINISEKKQLNLKYGNSSNNKSKSIHSRLQNNKSNSTSNFFKNNIKKTTDDQTQISKHENEAKTIFAPASDKSLPNFCFNNSTVKVSNANLDISDTIFTFGSSSSNTSTFPPATNNFSSNFTFERNNKTVPSAFDNVEPKSKLNIFNLNQNIASSQRYTRPSIIINNTSESDSSSLSSNGNGVTFSNKLNSKIYNIFNADNETNDKKNFNFLLKQKDSKNIFNQFPTNINTNDHYSNNSNNGKNHHQMSFTHGIYTMHMAESCSNKPSSSTSSINVFGELSNINSSLAENNTIPTKPSNFSSSVNNNFTRRGTL